MRFWKSVLTCVTAFLFAAGTQAAQPISMTVRADQPGAAIEPAVYGQFAEHLGRLVYEGIWVGESAAIPNTRGYRDDVIAALKELGVPVLRWPGGCFADEYNWRDGIGPREQRPRKVNTHWGGVVEDNSLTPWWQPSTSVSSMPMPTACA